MDTNLETWITSLSLIVVPVVVYCLYLKCVFLVKGNSAKKSFTACDSSECVRCSKYQQIRLEAFNKLCQFSHSKQICSELQRLFQAIEIQPDTACNSHPNQQPNVLYVPGLSAQPWWNVKTFQRDIDVLERNVNAILREYKKLHDELLTGNHSGWSRNNTSSGQWNVFYFYNQGVKNVQNCLRCPETFSALENVQNLMRGTLFFNASFSVLRADTLIDEHYGPTNTRLRCHLGLDIPGDCQLTVCGVSKFWEKGKCLLFDDSFLHNAQNNNTDGRNRVVLLLDFWHPQLTEIEREAVEYVFWTMRDEGTLSNTGIKTNDEIAVFVCLFQQNQHCQKHVRGGC